MNKKQKTIFSFLMVFIFVLTLFYPSSSFTAEAAAEAAINSTTEYIIYAKHSGKCLEPTNFSTDNGTQIRQWDYWGDISQRWKFVPTGDGYYYIENAYSGKVMDINGKSTADNANNVIYQKNGGANQQFELISSGDGYYYIKNRNSGKALDISGASTSNGGICIQYTLSYSNNQKFSIVAAGTGSGGSSSGLTANFDHLNKSQIVAAMGAGWNLGNSLEATIGGTPSETAWGNPAVTKTLIQAVKNAGFNTIRIPVSYLSKIGKAPDYTIDSSWLARIKQVVDYAYSLDMYVIINVHGDGYNSVDGGWLLCNGSNQTAIREKFAKVWQQIANTFKDYDEHLIFESMNEVFDGTYGTPNKTYYSNINALNQIFIDTVRQTGDNNAARWLLIPGWNTDIEYTAGNYGFTLPTDSYRSTVIPGSEKRIMISVHYYSPWDFCGEESTNITQWGSSATNSSKKSTWGQEDFLDTMFARMNNVFVSQGYPVIIGEYGSVDKSFADSSNTTYRAKFANAVCKKALQYGCVPVIWDNGYNGNYGFGLFNRSTGNVTQATIVNAIKLGMQNVSY